MKIKVCGMKYPENIAALSALPIDFMGLIFYPRSPRYADQDIADSLNKLPCNIRRVGVFVDADKDTIADTIDRYSLNMVQLHGSESPAFCKEIAQTKPVIKAFSIAQAADLTQTADYEGICQLFVFDTKTPQHGGSGQKFDWSVLDAYTGHTPFLLSGGISAGDAANIHSLRQPMLAGVDLNSRFEAQAGLKDIELLKKFINEIQS